MFHQNINGLDSKIDMLKILLQETKKSTHLLGITESHLSNTHVDAQFEIDGYKMISDRVRGQDGGVCIYIRDDMNWQRRYDLEHKDIVGIWLELFIKKSKSLLIGFIYRPPDSSKHPSKDFYTFANVMSTVTAEDKEVILAGDLHCNYLKSSDHKDLKDTIKVNGLKQLIQEPTRITKETSTLIDIIASTHQFNIVKGIVFANGISDHDLSGIIRKLNNAKYTPRRLITRNYKNYNKDVFKNDLKKSRGIPYLE